MCSFTDICKYAHGLSHWDQHVPYKGQQSRLNARLYLSRGAAGVPLGAARRSSLGARPSALNLCCSAVVPQQPPLNTRRSTRFACRAECVTAGKQQPDRNPLSMCRSTPINKYAHGLTLWGRRVPLNKEQQSISLLPGCYFPSVLRVHRSRTAQRSARAS